MDLQERTYKGYYLNLRIVFLSVHIIKSVIVITTRNKGLCSCKIVLLMTVLYIMMLFLLKF